MEEYRVTITPDAEFDLNELDDYITLELLAPETAVSYLNAIKNQILSLRTAPRRYRVMEEEPWHSRGVRRMNARNFAVFYVVLEPEKEVYIQNIIYQKRDLPKVLREYE